MKKQVKMCLYAIMMISLIACGFIGTQRIQVESQYKEIEIAVKYSDILKIAEEEEKTVEEVLSHYIAGAKANPHQHKGDGRNDTTH